MMIPRDVYQKFDTMNREVANMRWVAGTKFPILQQHIEAHGMKKVNTDETVQTVSGLPARIICTDFYHKYPIIALIEMRLGQEQVRYYDIHGRVKTYSRVENNSVPFDLINVSKPKWVRLYSHKDGELHLQGPARSTDMLPPVLPDCEEVKVFELD